MELLTPKEVADMLRVSHRTVLDWVVKGRVPGIKIMGQWRIRKEDVDAMLVLTDVKPKEETKE